jgi:8-oxo-dGTP pyrophosphatase MutT (NUDIX family)
MMKALEKVTAFVTRPTSAGIELLLFRHPTAGIQIPAGTVEEHEAPSDAALREVYEETGLKKVSRKAYIGVMEYKLSSQRFVILHPTTVYSRPDETSFDWASFRRGIYVMKHREATSFTHVTYEEGDRFPNPSYISYQITGWVPSECLTNTLRRHFYHLIALDKTPDEWQQYADKHVFTLFWAPLSVLPEIVAPQDEWIEFVTQKFSYSFEEM